jgi:nucleoside-diphosphate-sugar epimerase
MKIIDVLNIIKNQMGFVGSFKKDMNKPIGHQIKNFSLNKMRKLIGDYKFTEFETGIKLTINWYKVNKDKLNEKI